MDNEKLQLASWLTSKISIKKVLIEKQCGYILLMVVDNVVIDYQPYKHQSEMLAFAEKSQVACICSSVAFSSEHHSSLYCE